MKRIQCLMLTLALPAGAIMAGQRVQETRSLSSGGTVSIENIAGSVTVIGWDRDEVGIDGSLGNEGDVLEVQGDEGRLSIEVVIRDGWHKNISGSDLEIRVPRGARLEIETVSAGITISEFEGQIEAESVSGAIDIKGRPRRVELSTVSSRIDCRIDGRLGEGEFESVSGRIQFEGDLSTGGDFDFETVSGPIELILPSGVAADFEVSTFSGSISNDFGFRAEKTSEYLPSKELTFSVGGGGARVSAETLSGSIRIMHR